MLGRSPNSSVTVIPTCGGGEGGGGGAGGWVGLGVCPPPVLTGPEAPSPEVLRQTCRVVSGSAALDSGLQGHHRPWAAPAHRSLTRAHAHAHAHVPTPPRQFMVLTGGPEALRKAVGGVSALTPAHSGSHRRSRNAPRNRRGTGGAAQPRDTMRMRMLFARRRRTAGFEFRGSIAQQLSQMNHK